MKKLLNRLKKLSFKQIIIILIVFATVLLIINALIITINPQLVTNNTVITNPDAKGYQIRQDDFGVLENILPYYQDNYSLTKTTKDGKVFINITYDKTDSKALPAAYLYLKQYGLVEGDSRIITTPREHQELF